MSDLDKIDNFLQQHHVLNLATTFDGELSVCSVFYGFSKELKSFVIASSKDTLHIQHILKNKNVAGSVVLETKTVGKIQGVQFRATCKKLENKELQKLYFKLFPQAIVMKPVLWQIDVKSFKMTDNRFGFGKKIKVEFEGSK